ncbi:sre G protein-coupled chemoreceptor domain-containing protein [Ditylenchus destructor]|uniref:Sre G protein-coupled chemoreceptor domain-containing protein n=1 Tax=Ditylenchus destructor TaxID=166010 RepID=A0AAD4RAZ0_9BILA|nr:sre G protein-coupled chemoreceptor domain-containing protein [Ditylenchus destructor]
MAVAGPSLVPFTRIAEAIHSTNQSTLFSVLLIFELCIVLSGFFLVAVVLILLHRTQFVHINCYRIVANMAWHYILFGVVPRFFEVVYVFDYTLTWGGLGSRNVYSNGTLISGNAPISIRAQSPVFWSNIMRFYFVFVGAFTLPASAIERCCAAIYVNDYERNNRSFISALLLLIVECKAIFLTCASVLGFIHFLITVIVIGLENIVALFIILYCGRKNINFYKKSMSHCPKIRKDTIYSLSARYQNVQNIRVAKMLRKMFVASWICTFLLVCIYIAVIATKNTTLSHLNWELFDLVIAIYANIVPFVIVREIRAFRREVYKGLRQLGCTHFSFCLWSKGSMVSSQELTDTTTRDSSKEPAPHLENVMGVKLIHSNPQDETAAHFTQLENMWDPKEVYLLQ